MMGLPPRPKLSAATSTVHTYHAGSRAREGGHGVGCGSSVGDDAGAVCAAGAGGGSVREGMGRNDGWMVVLALFIITLV